MSNTTNTPPTDALQELTEDVMVLHQETVDPDMSSLADQNFWLQSQDYRNLFEALEPERGDSRDFTFQEKKWSPPTHCWKELARTGHGQFILDQAFRASGLIPQLYEKTREVHIPMPKYGETPVIRNGRDAARRMHRARPALYRHDIVETTRVLLVDWGNLEEYALEVSLSPAPRTRQYDRDVAVEHPNCALIHVSSDFAWGPETKEFISPRVRNRIDWEIFLRLLLAEENLSRYLLFSEDLLKVLLGVGTALQPPPWHTLPREPQEKYFAKIMVGPAYYSTRLARQAQVLVSHWNAVLDGSAEDLEASLGAAQPVRNDVFDAFWDTYLRTQHSPKEILKPLRRLIAGLTENEWIEGVRVNKEFRDLAYLQCRIDPQAMLLTDFVTHSPDMPADLPEGESLRPMWFHVLRDIVDELDVEGTSSQPSSGNSAMHKPSAVFSYYGGGDSPSDGEFTYPVDSQKLLELIKAHPNGNEEIFRGAEAMMDDLSLEIRGMYYNNEGGGGRLHLCLITGEVEHEGWFGVDRLEPEWEELNVYTIPEEPLTPPLFLEQYFGHAYRPPGALTDSRLYRYSHSVVRNRGTQEIVHEDEIYDRELRRTHEEPLDEGVTTHYLF